jgi:hypothetical protein
MLVNWLGRFSGPTEMLRGGFASFTDCWYQQDLTDPIKNIPVPVSQALMWTIASCQSPAGRICAMLLTGIACLVWSVRAHGKVKKKIAM